MRKLAREADGAATDVAGPQAKRARARVSASPAKRELPQLAKQPKALAEAFSTAVAAADDDAASSELAGATATTAAATPSAAPLPFLGPKPDPRWGHTATSIGRGRVVVYGGQSEEDKCSGKDTTLGNLFVFDAGARRWEEPVNCDSVPRAWHTASFLKEQNLLVTFGGERVTPVNEGGDGSPEVKALNILTTGTQENQALAHVTRWPIARCWTTSWCWTRRSFCGTRPRCRVRRLRRARATLRASSASQRAQTAVEPTRAGPTHACRSWWCSAARGGAPGTAACTSSTATAGSGHDPR